MKKSCVIGITGPAASGKDEACRILKAHGFRIIDADRAGHEVLKDNKGVKAAILKVFGKGILSSSGSIDRKKLGSKVFGSAFKLRMLDRIMHPVMRKMILRDIKSSRSLRTAVNAAVLKELGLIKYVDKVVCVTASKEIRIGRLIKGRGFSRQSALAVIGSQMNDKGYRRISDIVITNNGTVGLLKKKIGQALASIIS